MLGKFPDLLLRVPTSLIIIINYWKILIFTGICPGIHQVYLKTILENNYGWGKLSAIQVFCIDTEIYQGFFFINHQVLFKVSQTTSD